MINVLVLFLSTNMHTDKEVLPKTLHNPIGKDPKESLLEEEVSQDLHDWNGEKTRSSEVFSAREFDIHYKSKKIMMNKEQENREQPTASNEPSHSEMFAVYSGDRSGHVRMMLCV